jgi:hypothetical protein
MNEVVEPEEEILMFIFLHSKLEEKEILHQMMISIPYCNQLLISSLIKY